MYRLIQIGMLTILTGCTALPQLFQTADDVLTDDCITIKVDRDAFQHETDVSINIEVKNKELTK